jgi:two-component system, NarL family, nitrate/nitrite response regulator NarL
LKGDYPRLTPRETTVLKLITARLANKQIATQLGISAKTVEHHVSNIFLKLRVTTRLGAALWAIANLIE